MPAAEIDIAEPLVRRLLAEQCPDLADLPLTRLASGWDNVIWRLGDDLTARLPRRALAAVLVDHEHRWLPGLAKTLPLPVPAPVRMGRPSEGYPWSWSVCPWLPGAIAATTEPEEPLAAAETLGSFLACLHHEAPLEAPENPYRGVPLAARDDDTRERVALIGDMVDGPAVLARWSELVDLPAWGDAPRWLHGDLHPANVLVHEGRVSAVIDFGDLTSGDPATDLAVAWMMLPPEVRPAFRTAAAVPDDDTWARARGWALLFAVMFLANSADNPLFTRLGTRALDAVLSDPG